MDQQQPGDTRPSGRAFELEAGVDVDTLLAGLAALCSGRRVEDTSERLALLDTPDGRLHAAGALLSIGAGDDGLRLRLQRPGAPDLSQSVPGVPAFAHDLPPGPLREPLRALADVRRLQPRLEVERRSAGLDVLDQRRKTVARLRLEELRLRPCAADAAWRPLPARLVLDGLRGYRKQAAALLAVLRSRPGLRESRGDARAPLIEALARTLSPPPPVPGADLRPGLRADEALRRIHRAHLAALRWNEPGVRADLDTEFLHDWRVAARRTRSLLAQMKRVFPAAEVSRFRDELGWLARLSGPLRDLDVFRALLQDAAAGPDGLPGLLPLATLLRERRDAEHRRLIEGLDSPRARAVLDEWEAFLARTPARRPAAEHARKPLAELAAGRVRKLHQRIVAAGVALGPRAPAADLHALRIECKKMRYLLDAARRLLADGPATETLAALKRLQQSLGDAQDAHVQAGLAQQAATDLTAASRATPEALLAVGRLSERLVARETAARAQFAERLAAFAAPATRAALRALLRRGAGRRP